MNTQISDFATYLAKADRLRTFCLLIVFLLLGSATVMTQAEQGTVREVRTLYPSEWGVPYPGGIAYATLPGHLFLLNKGSAEPSLTTSTVVAVTPYEDLVGRVQLEFAADDAINVAYHDADKQLFLFNNERAELAQLLTGEDGLPAAPTLARFDLGYLALQRVAGMAVDLSNRRLLFLDSGAAQIVGAALDNEFALLTRLDLSHLGAATLRGLAIHPVSQHLFVIDPIQLLLYELTQSGQLLKSYTLAPLAFVDVRGFAFGPSADLTDAPDTFHLFIADSHWPDGVSPQSFGRIVEVSLEPVSSHTPQTIIVQVASSQDDSEETVATGATDVDSSDLELIQDTNGEQLVGLRFPALPIPAGVTILNAYIEFTADQKDDMPTTLIFQGEASANAAPFAEPNSDISQRTLTTASVTWMDLPAWMAGGERQQTPDLVPIMQEIVDQAGWQSGNAVAFVISGTGKRTATAYDGNPAQAPQLVVEYVQPMPTATFTPLPSVTATSTPTPLPTPEPARLIHVPADVTTIQGAIDLAADGDIVLVSPGNYDENIQIVGKTISLVSHFYTTNDPSLIEQTIIDGRGSTVITVDPSVGPATKIMGFTIQNGNDGISTAATLQILHNRFIGNRDAIDYEGGGGLCRHNLFENNGDDAIDLDRQTAVIIEDNLIRHNGDDGIEIRLQPYRGPTLDVIIRRNTIMGNDEDGIQLIGYGESSDRFFLIERNLIKDNVKAGLGLMDNQETSEDFRGASIGEPIHLFNNTFVANDHGVTGGDNLIALNNMFVNTTNLALKNVDGNSLVAYSLFWANGLDQQNSTLDAASTLAADPHLDANHGLSMNSPAIDAGVAFFTWNSTTVLALQPDEYSGVAPDLGAYELQVSLQSGGNVMQPAAGLLFLPLIVN